MKLPIATTLFALAIAAPAQADPLANGRQTAAQFLAGDIATFWASATPEMQQALGSAERFAAIRTGLLAEFGKEEAVLSERIEPQAGLQVYTRLARWSGSAAPLALIAAFDPAGRIAGFFLQVQPVAAESPHLDYQTRAALRLPFDGEWYVYWGGREIADNYHAANGGQRFALDLLIQQDGQSHAGQPATLASYFCWGQPILAPADGLVLRAVDGLADQPIGARDTRRPLGNHVVIDFGHGEYGFLAHLQQGSLRVAEGARVGAGQEIGRCGNSGNSSEPHLHFHMQTGPKLGEGDGLPMQFGPYRANGMAVARGEPRRGETIQPAE